MPDLAKYIVSLEAQTAKYERNLGRANKRLEKFERRNQRSLALLKKGFVALAGVASVRVFAGYVKSTIEAADDTLKLTQRIGGTTEAMSELAFVAERNGVAQRTLALGLQRMTRRAAEAAEGTGEAKDAIRELNVDARALIKLPLDQQFEILADRLSKVTNEAQRVRLAMKLFDSEGVALVQIMQDGARGIEQLRKKAQELGVTLTNEAALGATRARDAITNMEAQVAAFSRNITLTYVPTIGALVEGLNELAFGPSGEAGRAASEIEKLEKELKQLTGLRGTPIFGEHGGEEGISRLLLDIERLRIKLESLEFMSSNFGRETAEAAEIIAEAVVDLSVDLDAIGKRADLAREKLDSFFDANRTEAEATRRATEQFFKDQDKFLREREKRIRENTEAARELGIVFASALEDAIVNLERVDDLLQALLKDIIRIIARKTIIEPLIGAISGIFTKTASAVPKFGRGGVLRAGQAGIVGDAGPELIVPGVTSTVIPGAGLGGISISQTNIFEGAGALDPATMIPILDANNRKLKAEIRDDLDRGKFR